MDYSKSLSNIPEERLIHVGITGAGTSAPTVRAGHGVTVTRTAEGVIKFSFTENPGTFVGIRGYAFGADTPSGAAGITLTRDTYVAPSGSTKGYIEVSFWTWEFDTDAVAAVAVDLATAQYLDITFAFSAQSVID